MRQREIDCEPASLLDLKAKWESMALASGVIERMSR